MEFKKSLILKSFTIRQLHPIFQTHAQRILTNSILYPINCVKYSWAIRFETALEFSNLV